LFQKLICFVYINYYYKMNLISTLLSKFTKEKKKEKPSEKSIIRQKIRQKKGLIADAEKEKQVSLVFEKIEALPEFINAETIMMYWSMPDELSTHNFIIKWSKKKQILLPVVKDDVMLVKPFLSKEELTQGSYGIWEPSVQNEFVNKIDLVIVPGIAFDKFKCRLGRGKGYYDRYFMINRITKIGIGYDFQLLDRVPTTQTDIKMDMIITAYRTIS